MKALRDTLLRLAMIAGGVLLLLKVGTDSNVLVILCAALIGVPAYGLIPGDVAKARDFGLESWKKWKAKDAA